MCGPQATGAADAGLGIAGATLGFFGQKAAYKANRTAANLDYANDREALAAKAVELDQERSESAFDTAIASAQAEGRIAASAADQGLAPTSFIQQLNAAQFGIGRQRETEDINDQNARQQLARETTGADIRRRSKINSVSKPNGVTLALGIAKSVNDGFKTAAAAKG